jgi:hypothetical protein
MMKKGTQFQSVLVGYKYKDFALWVGGVCQKGHPSSDNNKNWVIGPRWVFDTKVDW